MFPAPAGMARPANRARKPGAGVPRACGDGSSAPAGLPGDISVGATLPGSDTGYIAVQIGSVSVDDSGDTLVVTAELISGNGTCYLVGWWTVNELFYTKIFSINTFIFIYV